MTTLFKLATILVNNPKTKDLVKKLQVINSDYSIDINEVIYNLNLPIDQHLFITSNFSELMQLKFNN